MNKVTKMKNSVKITVEIDVPYYWVSLPDKKYEEIRKKIYSRWALVKYMTGKTAEEWMWDANSHLYGDGSIAFLDAIKAIENAIEALITRKIKKLKSK